MNGAHIIEGMPPIGFHCRITETYQRESHRSAYTIQDCDLNTYMMAGAVPPIPPTNCNAR